MSGTEWFCGVQLGGVKLPAVFPAARNSKSMVHAGTGRWRQNNGRPMLIVGSRLAVYRMAVVQCNVMVMTSYDDVMDDERDHVLVTSHKKKWLQWCQRPVALLRTVNSSTYNERSPVNYVFLGNSYKIMLYVN